MRKRKPQPTCVIYVGISITAGDFFTLTWALWLELKNDIKF